MDMVTVEVFVDKGVSDLFMLERTVADSDLCSSEIPSSGVKAKAQRIVYKGGGIRRRLGSVAFVVGKDEIGPGERKVVDAGDLVGEVDGIRVETEALQLQVHVFAPPRVAFKEMDIGQLQFLEIEFQSFGGIFFFRGLVRIGEIVDEELIVPDRVGTLQLDGGVFQPDVLQLRLILEKEPVGDVHFHCPGIEKGIFPAVFDEDVLQQHFVEEGEIDMPDPDACMQVVG